MLRWLALALCLVNSSLAFACKPFLFAEVLFPKGGYTVTEANSKMLKQAVARYQPLEKATIEIVIVLGHASLDEHASEEGRRMLSVKRAMSVIDWLAHQGIPYSKLYFEGKGSIMVANKPSESGRSVEVELNIIPFPDPCSNFGPKPKK